MARSILFAEYLKEITSTGSSEEVEVEDLNTRAERPAGSSSCEVIKAQIKVVT